jgi:2-polyprenyl-6-methoxyphenol hydroxylase-like FAD-dependent oxidoreductase
VPRIETVPAAMLSFLIDFGVHPRRIGVTRLHERQHVAWSTLSLEVRAGRAMAHIDHARLQSELFGIAARARNLDLIVDERVPARNALGWRGSRWSAGRLIDATGRAAVTAETRVAPPKPWVARPFWGRWSIAPDFREFRIAALPFGYAYRVGNDDIDMLWVVGRGSPLSASPEMTEAVLKKSGAAWLLEGMPRLRHLSSGRAYPVSVQWARHCDALAVGDAALARDVLGSQGMAAGLSSACYAAACEMESEKDLLLRRQAAERTSHLRTLSEMIGACRYGRLPLWQQYRSFLDTHAEENASRDSSYLSGGRLVAGIRH